jgi:hypothetical protein
VQNSTQLYILRFLLGVAAADFLRLCRQRAVLERHGVSLRYGQGSAKAGSGSLILAGHVYWLSTDGRFVYASNRGHDSIDVFRSRCRNRRLSSVRWIETWGKGRHPFVANEDSDTIVRFDRDAERGTLINPTTVARTGSPTCLLLSTSGN